MSQPAAETATTSAPQLKYLGFLRVAAIKAYVFLVQIYEHLKDKAGPLKPGIESAEGKINAVVGPLWGRVVVQADEYLKLADEKTNNTVKYAEQQAPQSVKAQLSSAYDFLGTVPEKAQVAADKYKHNGAVATAQEYLGYFYPILFTYIAQVYKFALTWPLVPQVAGLIQPYAVAVARQYNGALAQMKKSNSAGVAGFAGLLPVIPVTKVKKQE